MWTFDGQADLIGLRVFTLLVFGLALACLVLCLGAQPMLEAPQYGLRGKRRRRARRHGGFAALEPCIRFLAAWVVQLPLGALRTKLAALVRGAGEPLGLCADEWLALSLLSLAGPGWTAMTLVQRAGFEPWWSVASLLLAVALPVSRLLQANTERAKQLERSLPTAMDLCVLCMGAGADFPSSLKFVTLELGGTHLVCREELSLVLDELELGRTRVEALSALGERTGSRAVREFVAAVCQSETKGTPLVQALSIQAQTLRQRRSVLAEEAAAKASVRLMFPLMLMVSSLLLIVFGPFIVNGLGM